MFDAQNGGLVLLLGLCARPAVEIDMVDVQKLSTDYF